MSGNGYRNYNHGNGRGRGINNAPAWMADRGGPPRRGGPPPRDFRRGPPPRRGGRGGGGGGGGRRPPHPDMVIFNSYEEERRWVEERRAKRKQREPKFDKLPTPEQAAQDAALQALSNPAATDFSGVPVGQLAAVPQQTRHARRLYIGNLPPNVSESEIHDIFYQAIKTATLAPLSSEDPILSTYINHERRFCFLEFRSVEMTSACLQFDGLEIRGAPCKVKRPNDYNHLTAPKVINLPPLDVSRLGIVGNTVPDGPNKIFIGGLHYYLNEDQVQELLSAFGKIKAFHLVKETPEATTSKGYAFVEYMDSSITSIAVQGLNGMDIGNDKTLTARLAGDRGALGGILGTTATITAPPTAPVLPPGAPPPNRTIVAGYDVEYLVDASLGQCPMPTAIQYRDSFGMPLTQIVAQSQPTRVLRLENMATDEDVSTEEARKELIEEIEDECRKFGALEKIKIHETLVFLLYANVPDALKAQQELEGREFGQRAIRTSFFADSDFLDGKLR